MCPSPRRAALFHWVLGLAIPALVAAGASSAAKAQAHATPHAHAKPSFILILADDLGWADVGFNGRKDWATPRLDQLAREGLRCDRFYTAAVVCAPSRAALLSGRSTIRNGVTRNDQELPGNARTLPKALQALGYRTALFGKWHQGRPVPPATEPVHPLDQGFDAFFGFRDAVHAWEKFPRELWDGRARVAVTGYADDLFTDRAVRFITESAQQKHPFFLQLALTATHFQIDAPPEEIALHQGKLDEPDPRRPTLAAYAAMVTRLDQHVGRILDALAQAGIDQSTLVVFTSDHGATFEIGNAQASSILDSNAPFRGQKRTLWEGGIRVPGLFRWPDHFPAGHVIREPVSMLDLFPTFLAAAGADHPEYDLDGRNLLPLLSKEERQPLDRILFFEWRSEGAEQIAAIQGPWKLIIHRGGKPELYNLEVDPAERRDLSATHPDVAKRLNQALQAWLQTETRNPAPPQAAPRSNPNQPAP
jgi:arylsulfatase A-like enzyme